MAVHGTSHGYNYFSSQQNKVMDGCLGILCPFQQCFSHGMTLDGWLKAECNDVLYKSISNRTLDAITNSW